MRWTILLSPWVEEDITSIRLFFFFLASRVMSILNLWDIQLRIDLTKTTDKKGQVTCLYQSPTASRSTQLSKGTHSLLLHRTCQWDILYSVSSYVNPHHSTSIPQEEHLLLWFLIFLTRTYLYSSAQVEESVVYTHLIFPSLSFYFCWARKIFSSLMVYFSKNYKYWS